MPGNPKNYPGWEKHDKWNQERIASWNKVQEYKSKTGRLPWQVKCRFCERVAVMCFANDISRAGTLRVQCCCQHVTVARQVLKQESEE